ncbi:MAG TPA: aspartyl/asparaginyl beta-hydroxylase domain-containing protein [Burkholderiales bacterium]|nr:aspartyl/asparaginyl beta-hydroxylase domain-containing protein [Burkholderiales bacterium]
MATLYDWSTEVIRKIYDSRITGAAVLDIAEHFPEGRRFVDKWPKLSDEAMRVANDLQSVPRFHELMPEQAVISANDNRDWRMLVLKAYGVSVRENLARCPVLAALVSSVPDVLSAALSFLAPGKHIPRHRGPFRGVTRFYLGLSVPASADGRPAAVLAIDDREYRIGNGECLLWDDTFPHEVWNRGKSVRTALLLDVRRRDMPLDMVLLSRALIAGIGASVRFRNISWHRNYTHELHDRKTKKSVGAGTLNARP